MSGLAGSEVQHVAISGNTSGDNEVVAAVAGKRIRVLAFFFTAAAAVTVRFESSAGGAALTGVMDRGANDWASAPFNPGGWFQTVAGESLNMELGGAVQVSGALSYVLVD